VEQEAAAGCDIIVLPETWTGHTPEHLESGSTPRMRKIAETHGVYIFHSIFRWDGSKRRNSAILIDRGGAIAGIYDKHYPYWDELNLVPSTTPGNEIPVFETDFGTVGAAICFDANFPQVWQQLADQGARLVFWPSAYSAGMQLQAHALNHHYTILTATLARDCALVDITGREAAYNKADSGVLVTRVAIDLNRGIYHDNFNGERIERLLAERPREVVCEARYPREQWNVLRAEPGVSLRTLEATYGLEGLRAYKARSAKGISLLR
jgi:apolipoprotein N-acyltransferase